MIPAKPANEQQRLATTRLPDLREFQLSQKSDASRLEQSVQKRTRVRKRFRPYSFSNLSKKER
jgi:hypothetical protein